MAKLRIKPILRRSGIKVFAVERVAARHSFSKSTCLLRGEIQPIAVVVCAGHDTYALNMEAQILDLEQLKRDIPELASIDD